MNPLGLLDRVAGVIGHNVSKYGLSVVKGRDGSSEFLRVGLTGDEWKIGAGIEVYLSDEDDGKFPYIVVRCLDFYPDDLNPYVYGKTSFYTSFLLNSPKTVVTKLDPVFRERGVWVARTARDIYYLERDIPASVRELGPEYEGAKIEVSLSTEKMEISFLPFRTYVRMVSENGLYYSPSCSSGRINFKVKVWGEDRLTSAHRIYDSLRWIGAEYDSSMLSYEPDWVVIRVAIPYSGWAEKLRRVVRDVSQALASEG